jgi:tRNA splicing endonuclease
MSQPSGRGGGRPRERGIRDINFKLIGNNENDGRHEIPTKFENKWLVSGSIASRLWNKSAIGLLINEGTVLTSEEVLFCHWHRHLPLPDNNWLNNTLSNDITLLHRAAALNTIREPGDVLVLAEISDLEHNEDSWGLRWNRGEHPTRNPPSAEIKWVSNGSEINWHSLFKWVESVHQNNRMAEILVVDGEFDVTAYRLNIVNPKGDLKKPSELSKKEFEILNEGWEQKIPSGEGYWIPIEYKEMPIPQLGVPQASGTWLAKIEQTWLKSQFNSENIDEITNIFGHLLEKGLWPRPGFKYGCRWRVYSGELSSQHAPWLIVPNCEAPEDWNEACLAARLAAGVNKSWLCAIELDTDICFLELKRWSPGKA